MPIQRIFQKKELDDLEYLEQYVQQLFKMAHSDGHMDECEYHFILKVAQRFEIEIDFEAMHQNLAGLRFDPASKEKYGFDLLFDLCWLILVDGEVDDEEIKLGTEIAIQMGYKPLRVKQLVSAIGEQKKLGLPPLEIKTKLKEQFIISA